MLTILLVSAAGTEPLAYLREGGSGNLRELACSCPTGLLTGEGFDSRTPCPPTAYLDSEGDLREGNGA